MRNIAICLGLAGLAACQVPTPELLATNGTPTRTAEQVEQPRQHKQECRRLYLLLGDRSLPPDQIQEVRLKRAAIFCFGEGA